MVGDIAAVEGHALDDVERGLGGDAEIGGDDTVGTDLLEGLGHQVAEPGIGGRNISDGGQGAILASRARAGFQRRHHGVDGKVYALHEVDSLGALLVGLDALLDQGVGEDDGRGGAVAGDLVGLHRDLAHHLRTHILETIVQFDLRGDGNAVARHHRRADRPVDHGIHALGTERRLHGCCELVNAAGEGPAGVRIVKHQFGHGSSFHPRGRLLSASGDEASVQLLTAGAFPAAGGTRSRMKSTSVGSPSAKSACLYRVCLRPRQRAPLNSMLIRRLRKSPR